MNYYLETNALYSIGKFLGNQKIGSFYTSIFSLMELVSGITSENFNKRKNIVSKVYQTDILVDYKMPEQYVFESFDIALDYEFQEQRVEPLKKIIDRIVASSSFEDFKKSSEFNDKEYGFDYFLSFDEKWSNNFIVKTIEGNKEIKRALNAHEELSFISELNINNKKDLETFFLELNTNRSLTILALTEVIKNMLPDKFSVKEIYESYNGVINIYVNAFSSFSSNKILQFDMPATNDFADLAHLLYLKDSPDSLIVSNDKLFSKFSPKHSISIDKALC